MPTKGADKEWASRTALTQYSCPEVRNAICWQFQKAAPHLVLSWLLIDQVRILYIQSKLRIALEHFLLGCSLRPLGSTIPLFWDLLLAPFHNLACWSGPEKTADHGSATQDWGGTWRLCNVWKLFPFFQHLVASEAASSPCRSWEEERVLRRSGDTVRLHWHLEFCFLEIHWVSQFKWQIILLLIHSIEAGASLQTVGDHILTSKFCCAALEAQSEEEPSADAEALMMYIVSVWPLLTVTTRTIPFLLRVFYKPLFAIVTGGGTYNTVYSCMFMHHQQHKFSTWAVPKASKGPESKRWWI